MKYPNGKKFDDKKAPEKKTTRGILNAGNRGMNFEADINQSNEYYNTNNVCLITKRPTPINIVKVDYSHGAIITNAYFEKQSTTDYNGVYKSRYIDFEAKNTKNRTSFPLANIPPQQIDHLKRVINHGGIAFFLIQFESLLKVYLIDASYVIKFYEEGDRKSIPIDVIEKEGIEIEQGLNPRLNYIKAVEEKYFK